MVSAQTFPALKILLVEKKDSSVATARTCDNVTMCALSHLSEFHLSSPFGFNEGGMLARMYNFNVSLGPIT